MLKEHYYADSIETLYFNSELLNRAVHVQNAIVCCCVSGSSPNEVEISFYI